MAETKIEWADVVWNPVTGCTGVSEGCAHCYARRMATRLAGRFGYPLLEPFRVTVHPERLGEPYRWKKGRRVFVCSMGDLFHRDLDWNALFAVWNVMGQLPRHRFLVLTKRAEEMQRQLSAALGVLSGDLACHLQRQDWCDEWPLPHVGVGVSVEHQAAVEERLWHLTRTPAAMRFVSCEPLLGSVRIPYGAALDWVIAGPETGPGARPCLDEWIEDLAEQCARVGVPFFDKRKVGWIRREFPKGF